MAHTNRRKTDHRRDKKVLKYGTRISIKSNGQTVYGTVSRVDEGGWIYPHWTDVPNGCGHLPPWFRSTQVTIEE